MEVGVNKTDAAPVCGLAVFQRVMSGRKQLGAAAGMVATSSGFVAAASPIDQNAARAPLVPWTAFACLLQQEVWRRNR
jgi:hypothetical protein